MRTSNPAARFDDYDSPSEADVWLVLQTLPGMTPERLSRLTEAFERPSEAFEAPPDVFARLCGRKAREVLDKDSPIDLAANIRREASKLGAGIITRDSDRYPEHLREIYAPPGAFFIEGEILAADRLAVAIVGMRRPTDYGRRVARELAAELARKGITIVSGLAYGIDAEAHKATLDEPLFAVEQPHGHHAGSGLLLDLRLHGGRPGGGVRAGADRAGPRAGTRGVQRL